MTLLMLKLAIFMAAKAPRQNAEAIVLDLV
jgi:hypothetical protein